MPSADPPGDSTGDPGPGKAVATAIAAFEAGDAEKAANLAQAAVDADPGDVDARQLLGAIQLHLGQADAARRNLERALELVPAMHEARFNLGLAFAALDDPAAALETFRAVLAAVPDHQGAKLNAAIAAEQLGDREAALRLAIGVVPSVERDLALELRTQGRFDEAEELLDSALSERPDDPLLWEAYERLAAARIERGESVPGMAIVVSYPKCGRTWLRSLLSLYADTDADDIDLDRHRYSMHLLARTYGVRLVFSHDDYPQLKSTAEIRADKSNFDGSPVIFLSRHPLDVAVSLFHDRKSRYRDVDMSIGEYVRGDRGGLEGIVRFYNIWAGYMRGRDNVLFLAYEDMHERPEDALARVLDQLGIAVDDDRVAWVVEQCAFDRMRRKESDVEFDASNTMFGRRDKNEPNSYKVRRGKVGGYRDELDADTLTWARALIDDTLDDLFARYKGGA